MDLSTKTLVELKALVYDQLAQKEFCERNIQALNQEIAKKMEAEQKVEAPKEIPAEDLSNK